MALGVPILKHIRVSKNERIHFLQYFFLSFGMLHEKKVK